MRAAVLERPGGSWSGFGRCGRPRRRCPRRPCDRGAGRVRNWCSVSSCASSTILTSCIATGPLVFGGLRLAEAGEQLALVSAPDCAATVERYLGQPAPELLSQAALEALAIVAYEQPVTRADIRAVRGVDSDAVVETLRARGLVADDPRYGGRGRPGFLVTTPAFLRQFGLASLNELPPQTTAASRGSSCCSGA